MARAERKNAIFAAGELKQRSPFGEAVYQGLNGYLLAASAAGVAVLACAMPAEGAPVCRSIDFMLLGTNTYALNPAAGPVTPFNVAQTFSSPSSHPTFDGGRLFLTPNLPRAETVIAENNLPADLPAGASIGPGNNFGEGKSYGLLFSTTRSRHRGNLKLGEVNYFGYKFLISGKFHYGWVRMKAATSFRQFAQTQILASGYESLPDTRILAGSCTGAEPARGAGAPPQKGADSSGQPTLAVSAASPRAALATQEWLLGGL